MAGPGLRALVASLLMISGCSQPTDRSEDSSGSPPIEAGSRNSAQPASAAEERSPLRESTPRPPQNPAEEQLQSAIRSLGESFDGDLGIAVRDLQSGWAAHFNGQEMFPQQSVSKLWVAIAALDQVDRGQLDLSEEVMLRREDLTLFYQPIRPLILQGDGHTTTLEDLLERAIARSDNTANDFLLRRIGGPDAVRNMLRTKGLGGIRFGPGERELQSEIAGLEWKPEYSTDRDFFEARRNVPPEKRRAAFNAYIEDPMDGATPVGIANALAKLKQGKLLSTDSTERLMSIMRRAKSGPQRLKGGLQPGWSIAHKTGTGQEFRGAQAGYNDVGVLTSPDGRTYSIAVLIGRTDQPVPTRMRLMQDVTLAVIEYDSNR